MQRFESREDVPEKYKWDLTDYFKDEDDFNKNYSLCQKQVKKLKEYVGCTKNPHKLYEFLVLEVDTIALWQDLYVYSFLLDDQELGNNQSISRKNKVEQINSLLNESISFFAPEILKINENEYNELFDNDARLLEFKFELDNIYRDKEHILSEKEEIIVSSLVNSVNHFSDMSSTMLNSLHNYGSVMVNGEEVTIAPTNYRSLMRDKDTNIRQYVRDNFNNVISQYAPCNAMMLSSYISMNDTLSKIRGFSSSWDQMLFNKNLNNKVFDTLVNTVEDNLEVLQRYYDLKRYALGFDELTCYDLALDITKNDREYSIEEGQNLVLNSIKVLGDEYYNKFKKIIDGRYVDYCQYKGKCSGGYSAFTLNNNSRILMSFNGDLDSISTLAHEGGHNVHHQFVIENNPKQYRDEPTIVDEVTSLTNECLLSAYLTINGKTKEEKLSGIVNTLDVIVSNLFGAVREGKIEVEMYNHVHNGGTLTQEALDDLSYNSLKKYYGNSVKLDNDIKNSWVHRSHYYMDFYLYNYAICVAIAVATASKILSGDQDFLNKYLEFLKAGSNRWPIDTFKILGVDLEDKSIYEDAIKYFDSLINKFYEIYDE